jgi:hypothetical protein
MQGFFRNDKLWKPKKSFRRKNKLRTVAWRPLAHKDQQRSLKLGTTRKWVFGFFDLKSALAPTNADIQNAITSDVYEIMLDSGSGGLFTATNDMT